MKKILLIGIVLAGMSINAQNKKIDSTSNWTKKGTFTLLFNQATFSNWIAAAL